jgi:hypothetical protein
MSCAKERATVTSEFLTPRWRTKRPDHVVQTRSKRAKSGTALAMALLIGATAAVGIVIVAGNDPNEVTINVAPAP